MIKRHKGRPENLRPLNSETAREAQKKSVEVRRMKYAMFKTVRTIIETTAPDSMVSEKIKDFWAKHNVPRNKITPLMAEITPIYANAINSGDMATLERIYRLLGLAFESSKEHNITDSRGEDEEKSFEVNYIVDGVKQEPQKIEYEQAGEKVDGR